MKRRRLWKTGRMGCVAPAVPSKLGQVTGPLSLLKERSVTTIVLLFSLCCRLPPKLGEMPEVYR